MPIIDCQSHIFSAEYANFLKRNKGRIQVAIEQGVYRIAYGDDLLMTIKAADYSVDRKLSDMDRSNIEISIVGPNIPGPEMLDMELRAEGARIINNATAEACLTNPARLIGLAVLPFSNLEETLAEYEYATKTLGFKASCSIPISRVGKWMIPFLKTFSVGSPPMVPSSCYTLLYLNGRLLSVITP